MYSIIAPSFFQKKKCVLPGIGSLSLVTHPAETDFYNTQIKAPRQEIVFATVTDANVFNEFSAISEMMLRHLAQEGMVALEGVGTFTKSNISGDISFSPIQIDAESVTAERVIHKDAPHNILVGDKETTNVVMAEFYNEEAVTKDRWWVWALVLAAIGIAAIALYIIKNGFNLFGSLF